MRAFEYRRVSTLQQRRGETVERQVRVNQEYAKRHKIQIVQVFEDLAFSGKATTRPAYDQMLELIMGREDVEAILVSELSRFGRGGLKTIKDVMNLNDSGKILIAPNSNFDTRTRQGKINLAIFSLVADLEHEDLMERLQMGKLLYVERGGILGPPFKTIPKAELEMFLMGGASYHGIADFYKTNNIKERPKDRKTIARIAKEHGLEHLNRHGKKGGKNNELETNHMLVQTS